MKSKQRPVPEKVLAQWTDRDLTRQRGKLPPAYAVDNMIDRMVAVLSSGRSVILSGPSGVGKTALVYEFARRLPGFEALGDLQRSRVIEMSFSLRMSRLNKPYELRNKLADLTNALLALEEPIMPFFRDGDLAYRMDLEENLGALCLQTNRPVILEGSVSTMRSMLEHSPDLEQYFVELPVDEPDLEKTTQILTSWSQAREIDGHPRFEPKAIEETIYLGHRFLARAHFPRKAIDILSQTAAVTEGEVTMNAVLARFCEVHHTPRWLMDPAVSLDLDELEGRLRRRLLGQDEAVQAAVSMIALLKASLSDMRRPFGVFLFVGPTGVGKTHLAQTLAEELFGSRDRMVRVNLGDFGEASAAHTLFGDPHAPDLTSRRGVITQRLIGRQFAVLLLDEFEKAHASIYDRFLPLIDEGHFTNAAGETISCRSMIIIATSNAGAEVYRGYGIGFTAERDLTEKRKHVERRVREVFRFELLNRFDDIVHFRPLDREEIRKIAQRELDALRSRTGLKRNNLELQVDESVFDWLAVHGYHPDYGARFLKRTIERNVTKAVAETIVRHSPPPRGVIELSVRANRVRAQMETPAPAVREPRTKVDGHAPTSRLASDDVRRRAEPRLAELDRHEDRRNVLLAEINEPSFWEDGLRRETVLGEFRELDVLVGIERRLAAPIRRFLDALKSDSVEKDVLASLRGQAEAAIRRWEERALMEGPRAVWLMLSSLDPLRPAVRWTGELLKILSNYCRRCELRYSVEAIEPHPSGATRVVVEVEGPGAEYYLAAEAGVHRMRRSGKPDQRVSVLLVPKSTKPGPCPVRPRTPRPGPFGTVIAAEGKIELGDRGLVIPLWGRRTDTLEHLIADTTRALRKSPFEDREEIRVYGETGGGVRDPRTDVTVPMRLVGKGRLESFLEAHRLLAPP